MVPSIAVGPVLRDAAVLTLQHWRIWLLGTLGIAGTSFSTLYIALQYGVGPTGIFFPTIRTWFGPWAGEVVTELVAAGLVIASMVPAVVMLYFFYASPRLPFAGMQYLRPLTRRSVQFAARVIGVGLLVLVPRLSIRATYAFTYVAFLRHAAGSVVLAVLVFEVALPAVTFAFLRARTIIYVLSVPYESDPPGIRSAWTSTAGVWQRPFLIFVILDLVLFVIQWIVTNGISPSGKDETFAQILAFVLTAALFDIAVAATSVTIYARLTNPLARVFD